MADNSDNCEDPKFHVRWDNHGQNTLDGLQRYLDEGLMTDMIISCDDFTIKCHRIILAATSHYFQRLLTTVPYLSSSNLVVVLKDIRYHELELVLQYMYKGSVTLSQDQLEGFIDVAHHLELKGIADEDLAQAQSYHRSSRARDGNEKVPPTKSPVSHVSGIRKTPCKSIKIENKGIYRGAEVTKVFERSKVQPLPRDQVNEMRPICVPQITTADKVVANVAVDRKRPVKSTFIAGQRRKKAFPVNKDNKVLDKSDPTPKVVKTSLDSGVVDNSMEPGTDMRGEIGISRYKRYSGEALDKAMEAVKIGMSAYAASNLYNVPSRTLYERAKKLGFYKSHGGRPEAGSSALALPENDKEKLKSTSLAPRPKLIRRRELKQPDVASCVPEVDQVSEVSEVKIENVDASHTDHRSSKKKYDRVRGGTNIKPLPTVKPPLITLPDPKKVGVKQEHPVWNTVVNSSFEFVKLKLKEDAPVDFVDLDPSKIEIQDDRDRSDSKNNPDTPKSIPPTDSQYDTTEPLELFTNTP